MLMTVLRDDLEPIARQPCLRSDPCPLCHPSGREEPADGQSLAEARELMATLVQNSPLAVVVTDPQSRVRMCNRAAEALLGWTADELVGKVLPTIPDDHHSRTEHERIIGNLLESGEGSVNLETQRVHKNGSLVDVLLSTAPLRDRTGRVASVAAFMFDITERKRLEKQFRTAQKMEAVGRLAGGVAHDFNNLLMTIRGYGDSLLEDMSPHDPRRENIVEIQRAAERATALTRQLLAFSRQQVLQPTLLDLNAVVGDMEKLLRRVIGADVALLTALDPALGAVRADSGQIEQVLMNLAVNARDAMPTGGTLRIRTANIVLHDEAALHDQFRITPGEYILLEVGDTGCGMSPDTQARIFEPFYTTKEMGTGLGLPTVYGIIKQSNGYIIVDSTPGQGTVVRVYLSRVVDGAPQPTAREPVIPGDVSGGSETILLVEDENTLRTLISRVLSRHGYTVLAAQNGIEALQLCQDHAGRIDLMLTDVVMPEMGGRELAERLATLRPEMRVCYMSGYTGDEVMHRGLADERLVLLQKPVAPKALAKKIREVLDATTAS